MHLALLAILSCIEIPALLDPFNINRTYNDLRKNIWSHIQIKITKTSDVGTPKPIQLANVIGDTMFRCSYTLK